MLLIPMKLHADYAKYTGEGFKTKQNKNHTLYFTAPKQSDNQNDITFSGANKAVSQGDCTGSSLQSPSMPRLGRVLQAET